MFKCLSLWLAAAGLALGCQAETASIEDYTTVRNRMAPIKEHIMPIVHAINGGVEEGLAIALEQFRVADPGDDLTDSVRGVLHIAARFTGQHGQPSIKFIGHHRHAPNIRTHFYTLTTETGILLVTVKFFVHESTTTLRTIKITEHFDKILTELETATTYDDSLTLTFTRKDQDDGADPSSDWR